MTCITESINYRYKQAVTEALMLANVLYPKYQGKNLKEEETSRAMHQNFLDWYHTDHDEISG